MVAGNDSCSAVEVRGLQFLSEDGESAVQTPVGSGGLLGMG